MSESAKTKWKTVAFSLTPELYHLMESRRNSLGITSRSQYISQLIRADAEQARGGKGMEIIAENSTIWGGSITHNTRLEESRKRKPKSTR